jgi:hypothetical protein
MSSYNVFQQVFALSLISNEVAKYKGTEANLQAATQDVLPGLLGYVGKGWEVAWGPKVWKHDPDNSATGSDNFWFVAKNPVVRFEDGKDYNTFVVSVAGTATAYGWLVDDFGVGSIVDFLAWIKEGLQNAPTKAKNVTDAGTYIAHGAALGVHTLASQPAPPGTASAGIFLLDLLACVTRSAPDSKLIFTGHSLGGALSPTLALGVLRSGTLGQFKNVLVYPNAGFSPGNGYFSKLFNSTFPKTAGSGYQLWNCNIVNKYDVAPQAWCTQPSLFPLQNLDNIPPIYGSPPLPSVKFAVATGVTTANGSGIIYNPIQSIIFSGTPPTKTPSTLSDFIKDAGVEHSTEYEEYFKVKLPNLKLLIHEGISRKTDREMILSYPVISFIAQEGPLDISNGHSIWARITIWALFSLITVLLFSFFLDLFRI